MYDENVPAFRIKAYEDFDVAYARALKKAWIRTEGMPEEILDELKRKLNAFGQDSQTSSYNGTPCKEWLESEEPETTDGGNFTPAPDEMKEAT